MTIQDLKNLDAYKCSLKDISKAYKVLSAYLQKLIDNGCSNDKWREIKELHVSISRARHGMDSKGYMIGYNIDVDRLPNSESVL